MALFDFTLETFKLPNQQNAPSIILYHIEKVIFFDQLNSQCIFWSMSSSCELLMHWSIWNEGLERDQAANFGPKSQKPGRVVVPSWLVDSLLDAGKKIQIFQRREIDARKSTATQGTHWGLQKKSSMVQLELKKKVQLYIWLETAVYTSETLWELHWGSIWVHQDIRYYHSSLWCPLYS